MNYLAHFYLAGDDEQRVLGNLLGDFVKGRLENMDYPPDIIAGIRQHRLVDRFTDDHPRVARSRTRIPPIRRRFAGIIVDMGFDHFLARHWHSFHDQPLADFSQRSYGILLDNRNRLPDRLVRVVERMAADDWLTSYRQLNNVERALTGIGHRLRRPVPLAAGRLDIEAAYAELEADFLTFFPELVRYALYPPPDAPHLGTYTSK